MPLHFQQMLVTLGSEEKPVEVQALDAELQKKTTGYYL